jgi:hypothetical protein
MSQINNEPVRVTGYEERRHPALRKLARACIELAREQLKQRAPSDESTNDAQSNPTGEVEPETKDV